MSILLSIVTISLSLTGILNQKVDSDLGTTQHLAIMQKAKIDNALAFVNSQVENINLKEPVELWQWVNSNSLTTKSFREDLKRLLDRAYKEEPEVGLDFDPILDAQDHPEKGFEDEYFDEKTNYLTVQGRDWPEFKVNIRIKLENGNWLVDGCGYVNIPKEQRAKR